MKVEKLNLKYDYNFFQDYFINKYKLNHLERDYFKYIDYENIYVFNNTEYDELKKITKCVNNIFLKAYEFYFESFDNHLEDFVDFKDYFSNVYNKDHFIARYDVLIDENWEYKFIEINANTPWLITDVYHIASKNKPEDKTNISEYFINYVRDFFKKYKWKKNWILLPYSYEDEDYLVCIDYKDILKDVIDENDIIVWDIFESNLIVEDFFTLKWEKIDILLSFFPTEFFLTDIDYFDSFLKVIKKWNLEIFNPLESIILQDKLIFAIIWENMSKYSEKEQEIIKKHIPFTTRVFSEDSDKFIAKDRFWRIWRWVYDKDFYTHIDDKDKFIYQEKVVSKKFDYNSNFWVLWVYTNMQELLTVIWRIQTDFVTREGNNKVVLCYGE